MGPNPGGYSGFPTCHGPLPPWKVASLEGVLSFWAQAVRSVSNARIKFEWVLGPVSLAIWVETASISSISECHVDPGAPIALDGAEPALSTGG